MLDIARRKMKIYQANECQGIPCGGATKTILLLPLLHRSLNR